MSSYQDLEMRKVYAKVVEELYKKDKNVYALEADLSSSMSTNTLKDLMGKNYLNLGIMEANMIGVSAGINLVGGYCFVHSFGQFVTRRAMDQIFISLAYAGLKACLIGSDAGISAEHNGGTHMTFEDVSIVRTIPNMEVYDVCDPIEFASVLKDVYENKKLAYIRTIRKKAAKNIYDDKAEFISGSNVIREGSDVTIVASGIEVNEALKACDILELKGIKAEVIDSYGVKPIDKNTIIDSVKKTNRIVVCENHSHINGLANAVGEILLEEYPVKMRRIGVKDKFGQVGSIDYLSKEYGLDSESIVKVVLELV